MPANNMFSQTHDLDAAANFIKQTNDEFTRAYEDVFVQFAKIDDAWDGDDNTEFNNHIMSFKADFLEMTAFMNRVENHLRLTAKAYLTVEAAGGRIADKLAK